MGTGLSMQQGCLGLTSRLDNQVFLAFWPEGAPDPQQQGQRGTLEESCSEEGLPPGAVAAVLSRADLCAESPYWAAQMEGPWAEHVMHDATTGWPVLLERGLSPAQLEGAKLLLNFLRTGKLQQPRSGGHTALAACQVCQVFQLAQRFDVPGCREACITAITALPPGQLSAPDACTLLGQLQDVSPEEKAQLQKVCLQLLLKLFGDVNKVLNSEDLWEQFEGLSLAAVLLWAQSDQVQVVSTENDVVAALGEWARAQPAGSVSTEQLEQLSACVRVKQLTQGHRLHLLQQDWFSPRNKLLELVGFLDSKRHGGSVWSDEKLVRELGLPPAWVAGPRAHLPAAEAEVRRTLEITASRQDLEMGIQQALAGEKWRTKSAGLWLEGQEFRMTLTVKGYKSEACVGLHLYREGPSHGMPVHVKQVLGHQRQTQHRPGAGVAWEDRSASDGFFSGSSGRGFSNIFKGTPLFSSVAELDAQGYLVQGALRVRCRLLEVD